MKFSAVLFAAGVSASTLVARQDVSTIQSALSSIGSAASALSDALTSYSGTGDLAKLQGASQSVQDAVAKAATDIKDVPELTLAEALTLQEPAQQLGDIVSKASQTAIDRKQDFVKDKLGPVILEQLSGLQSGADSFANLVVSKVPVAAQGIAKDLIAPINDALKKVLDAYADQAGGDTSPAPSSGGASSAAPSSAAPTGAATPAPSKPAGTPAPSKPAGTPAPQFTGAASANTVGFAAAALALVAAL